MTRPVLLLPIGSSGDVNPFLWIGRLLRAKGHEVTVIANPVFESAVRNLGLRFVPFGDDAEYHSLLDHPHVWHPTKGPPLVLRYAGDVTQRHFELIQSEVKSCPELPLVLAPSTAFGARVAREKCRFPLVTVNLQPCVMMTPTTMPLTIRGMEWLEYSPIPIRRAFLALIQAKIGPLVGPGVGRACRAAGIREPANAFRDWWQAPDGSICLWPEWYVPPRSDWPPRVRCVGFPLYDLADQIPLASEVEAFLAAGPPPLLFTPGTAMTQGAQFFRTALAACRKANLRAIFATKYPGQLPADLPSEFLHVSYAPFSMLLPRCAGIIHHGGIGTTSQALAGGIPQLIVPFSHDQPDNASHIRRLGCGDWLWPGNFTIKNVAPQVTRFLDHEPLRSRCAKLAARIGSDDAPAHLIDALAPHLHA